jgi:hypothetical protein
MSQIKLPFTGQTEGGVLCPLCHEPVNLENSKADEDGQAIHEDCYARLVCHVNDGNAPER